MALINAGGIRVDLSRHPESIYPAGEIVRQDVLDMLPFGNTGVLVDISGRQLKQVLERSVAQLPVENSTASGAFMQVSFNVKLHIDLTRSPQRMGTQGNITEQGERIKEIIINGRPITQTDIFIAYVPSFIAAGGDGYSTFEQISLSNKRDNNVDMALYLEKHIQEYSPVSPRRENRINF